MTLRERLADAGIETLAYSGRGMYGAECLGAVADTRETIYAAISSAHIRSASCDSMGKQTAVYWPHIAYKETP